MLSKIKKIVKECLNWLKKNESIIILVAIVILLTMFSFAIGYITGWYQNRPSLKIE